MAMMASRSSYDCALRVRRSNRARIARKTALVSLTGSPRGRTTVRMAESSVAATMATPSRKTRTWRSAIIEDEEKGGRAKGRRRRDGSDPFALSPFVHGLAGETSAGARVEGIAHGVAQEVEAHNSGEDGRA